MVTNNKYQMNSTYNKLHICHQSSIARYSLLQTRSQSSMGIKEIEIGGYKLTIEELDDLCDSSTGRILTGSGSWVWSSSLFLAEWMMNRGRSLFDFHGKTVIELGSGMGVPGLTAALLGASRVVLTDVVQLLPGLWRNVELNELEDRVEVRELVWGSDESCACQGSELFDLVVMSDVFYDINEMEALGKTLKRACGMGTKVWAACEIRPWTSELLDELVCQGFEVTELTSQLGYCSVVDDDQDSASTFAIFDLVPPRVVGLEDF